MGQTPVPVPLLRYVKLHHRPSPGLTRRDDRFAAGEHVFLLYAVQWRTGVLLSDVMMILFFYLLIFFTFLG